MSQNGTWLSSAFGTHKKGTLIKDGATAPHIWDGTGTYALVTHNGDFLNGDGVSDWVVRTPDGRLFIYPGDGYGAIDVTKRVEVRLPASTPAPSTFSEIKSAGDITGDGSRSCSWPAGRPATSCGSSAATAAARSARRPR